MKRKNITPATAQNAKTTLAARRNLPHMSASAFTEMVNYAKNHDISQLSSSRKRFADFKAITLSDTPYGPIIVKKRLFCQPPHAHRDLVLVNPMAYMHTAFKAGGGFSTMLTNAMRSTPSTPDRPWRLVLYSDEVVPGNQLSAVNSRKFWVIYFGFLEFGLHLHSDEAWCPLVCEPSIALRNVHAGFSQVFAAAVHLFFGSLNFDGRHGTQLDGPDTSDTKVRLYFELSMVLQDGGAHKTVWSCKGDAGTKLCMMCLNLRSEKSGIATDGSDLVCDSIHEHQLQFATDADIMGSIARLEAFKLSDSATNFKIREQAIGFTLLEHSLLTNPHLVASGILKPASQFCHDWMHGIFVGGVFNVILSQLLADVQRENGSTQIWRNIADYISTWRWRKLAT